MASILLLFANEKTAFKSCPFINEIYCKEN